MKLPKKIDPCPIIESVVEIRFNSNLPKETIIGLFYSQLKPEFTPPQGMPILNFPSSIRDQDITLKYQPHYELKKDNILIRLGPKVLAISNVKEYLGWDILFDVYKKIIEQAKSIELFSNIERVGVRYINFFKDNMIEKTNIELKLNNESCNQKNYLVRIEDDEGKVKRILHISNGAQMRKSGETSLGTVIDIDCVQSSDVETISLSNIIEKIDSAHMKEKEYFYRILKKEYIETLNPIYED